MMRHASLAIVLALFLAACGSKQSAPEPEPTPDDGTGLPVDPEPGPGVTMSEEECIAAGGQARWDIGDGQVACDEGEEEIARIPVGIEGGICCRPVAAAE